MFKRKSEHSYIDLFEGILIGGSLGAMTTFLFGTKKGKEVQKHLMQKYKKIGAKAEHMRDKLDKAMKSPVAKKIKRAAKKVVKKTVRKTARKVRSRKVVARKKARR